MRSMAVPPSNMDYTRMFGLAATWALPELKLAFRKLAKKYHPDMNPEDREADAYFKFVNQGYEALCRIGSSAGLNKENTSTPAPDSNGNGNGNGNGKPQDKDTPKPESKKTKAKDNEFEGELFDKLNAVIKWNNEKNTTHEEASKTKQLLDKMNKWLKGKD